MPQNPESQSPTVEIKKEIRLAVVMYGGGSLAIYINGVAQEFYRMVRATAGKWKPDGSYDYLIKKVEGIEGVYRQLGEHLKARIVVDILSGTSAGGINAVYLAKALTRNQPMFQLEKLWIDQGDIQKLINDRGSVNDIDDIIFTQPPNSLLNSKRMYSILLAALDKMELVPDNWEAIDRSLVDELDLYVTATDVRGLRLPVPLVDTDPHEYRYRTEFHFHHSDRETSFVAENNPFLAFAARATSAFPFAFEPIKLEDVKDVLERNQKYASQYTALQKNWPQFYKDYNPETENFDLHSFGDGGYLDNKPFSYITATLRRRSSDTLVDRRLFYIEPAPERLKKTLPPDDRPDAFENVYAALIGVPRYETIRDDLLQIKARNDLLERRNNILRQIEGTRNDLGQLAIWKSDPSNNLNWSSKYLDEILVSDSQKQEQVNGQKAGYGWGYAAYHQLRVADTLDELTRAIARNICISEESESFTALRRIIEEWGKTNYSSNSKNPKHLPSENELLFRLDLGWRVRPQKSLASDEIVATRLSRSSCHH